MIQNQEENMPDAPTTPAQQAEAAEKARKEGENTPKVESKPELPIKK